MGYDLVTLVFVHMDDHVLELKICSINWQIPSLLTMSNAFPRSNECHIQL